MESSKIVHEEGFHVTKVRIYTGKHPAGVATIALDDAIEMLEKAESQEYLYGPGSVLEELRYYRSLTDGR